LEPRTFSKAIVRTPGKSLVNGLTTSQEGPPNFNSALQQHSKYVEALQKCGLQVQVLAAQEEYPDSTFIEDVALMTPHCAIITNPGAPSRRGETEGLDAVLSHTTTHIEYIRKPGCVEAGDILMVGSHYYIGLSERTNIIGARQIIHILQDYGMTGSLVKLHEVLHLKTGVAYLEHNNLVACGEFITHPEFQKFNILPIPEPESYAANCIWVNDTVLIPAGYPRACSIIKGAGYSMLEVNVSEFRKLDGGMSCLSLRF